MFELESVGKAYGETVSLTAATLTIEDGEFFVLVGSSGSGKTTLLKLLNRRKERSGAAVKLSAPCPCARSASTRGMYCSKSPSFPI